MMKKKLITLAALPLAICTLFAFAGCDPITLCGVTITPGEDADQEGEIVVIPPPEDEPEPNDPPQIEIGPDRLEYTLGKSNDGSEWYSVTGIGECTATDLVIPSVFNGLPVKEIGQNAFFNCTNITSVTIPDGIWEIGGGAFQGCNSLTSVTIPESVTWLWDHAFKDCTDLASLSLPSSLDYLGSETFRNCTSLTSISLPESLNERGYLGDYLFENCTSLTSIHIPSGIKSIGMHVFDNTPYYNQASNWEGGVLYFDHYLIEAKTSVSGNYQIKPGTTVVAGGAFHNCTSLTGVTIPDSVVSLCDGLEWTGPHSGQEYGAFMNCTSLTSITIPDSVDHIENHTFKGCTNLASVTLSNSITDLPWEVFQDCTSLTGVTIPDSVQTIGINAFANCKSLISIVLPENVRIIYDLAFSNCTSLMNFEINSESLEVYRAPFSGCTILQRVTFPADGTRVVLQNVGINNSTVFLGVIKGSYTLTYEWGN